MEFEDQLNAMVYFHLEKHTSGHHLLQALEEDEFAHSIDHLAMNGVPAAIPSL